MNRRHMTGDHRVRAAGRATLLARAIDEIFGTHRSDLAIAALARGRAQLTGPTRIQDRGYRIPVMNAPRSDQPGVYIGHIGGSARVLPELLHHSTLGERATACSVSGLQPVAWTGASGHAVRRRRR